VSSEDDDPEEWFDAEEVIEEGEFDAEGWDEIPDDPEKAWKVIEALEGIMPDILKRTIAAGVGSISTSEERIREMLADQKLPREVVAYMLKQADSTKREFIRVLSREIRAFLEDADLGGELAKILTTLSLEARIQVRFVENEDSVSSEGVKPKGSGKFRVTRANSDEKNEDSSGRSDSEEDDEREEGGAADRGSQSDSDEADSDDGDDE
jgi:hypothetical protein